MSTERNFREPVLRNEGSCGDSPNPVSARGSVLEFSGMILEQRQHTNAISFGVSIGTSLRTDGFSEFHNGADPHLLPLLRPERDFLSEQILYRHLVREY